MYLYNFGPRIQTLGQGQLVNVSAAGLQEFSPDAMNALMQLFLAQYPVLTSSWTAKTGSAQPGMDDKADLWSYQSVSQQQAAGGVQMTTYDLLQSVQAPALFLVDVNSAQGAIAGSPNPVVFAIARDAAIASVAGAGPSGSLAILRQTPGQAPATPSSPVRKKANAGAVVAGVGLAALVALAIAAA